MALLGVRERVAVAPVASAAEVDPVAVLVASVCCLSTVEASLTEAPAPSLLHIDVKMALVGFIGTRSEHRAEDAAGVVAHRFQERSLVII